MIILIIKLISPILVDTLQDNPEREFERNSLSIFLKAFYVCSLSRVGIIEGGFKAVHDIL